MTESVQGVGGRVQTNKAELRGRGCRGTQQLVGLKESVLHFQYQLLGIQPYSSCVCEHAVAWGLLSAVAALSV